MTEASSEIRELVRSDLAWLANFLMAKFGMTADQAKRIIRETLEVSV